MNISYFRSTWLTFFGQLILSISNILFSKRINNFLWASHSFEWTHHISEAYNYFCLEKVRFPKEVSKFPINFIVHMYLYTNIYVHMYAYNHRAAYSGSSSGSSSGAPTGPAGGALPLPLYVVIWLYIYIHIIYQYIYIYI